MNKLLLFAFTLFLISCSKGNDDPEYFIKLKVNGNWSTHTDGFGDVNDDIWSSSGGHHFSATFLSDNNKESFTFGMSSAAAFVTGNYDSDNPPASTSSEMYVSYSLESPAYTKTYKLEDFTGLAPSHYIFTITKITNELVEGSFTGNYLTAENMNETIPVTEGQFRVKLLQ